MRRYLLVALWPAGLAAIAAGTIAAARRAPGTPAALLADGLGRTGKGAEPGGAGPGAAAAGSILGVASRIAADAAVPDVLPDLLRLGAMSAVAGAGAYGVMTLIGPAVVNHGPDIDKPIHQWINDHQVRQWAAVLDRLNKVGNTWTTWGACGAAAACLSVTWPRRKWLPPAVLGAAIMVDHYATLALRHRFNRLGPPTSPLGTYPAGGPDRVVFLYGLIAHLLWREFSGSQRGKIWAIGSVTGLAFHQAYCREYLSKHWFSDILSGLLYGGVMLAPFIGAVRLIAGPATGPAKSR